MEGGRLNTRYGRRGGKKYKRREETGKKFCRARHPDEYRRGGKGRNQKSSRTGNTETLKIGTESRVNHSLCLGLELHHPIMSKLWNLGGQTKRKKNKEGIKYVMVDYYYDSNAILS